MIAPRIDSNRLAAILVLASVALVGCAEEPTRPDSATDAGVPQFAKKQKTELLATGRMAEGDPDNNKVRSDGRGRYDDQEDCVSVRIDFTSGTYQLRTISNVIPGCKDQTRDVWRFLTLDLGAGNTFNFDQDRDGPEGLEEAPARLVASRAFHKRAESTPVIIRILEVKADETGTTQESAFEITYRNEAHIIVVSDTKRVIYLEPTEAAADVCERKPAPKGKNKFECVHIGTIADLPFRVTAEAVDPTL